MLLPDFLLIIHTYFHCPTFNFKTTNPNSIFLLPNPLFGNSNQLSTITTGINPLRRLSSFLTHSHIYYSLTILFCLTIFLSIFLIPTLFLHTATSTSLFTDVDIENNKGLVLKCNSKYKCALFVN